MRQAERGTGNQDGLTRSDRDLKRADEILTSHQHFFAENTAVTSTKSLCFILTITVSLSFGCRSTANDALSLPISIAQDYQVTKSSKESISSPIPDQKPTAQIHVEVTKNGKIAHILYWNGRPYRDLGPLVEEESWQYKFLGEEARITRTVMFMGQEQRVLVVHFKSDKKTQLMIYSKDMNKEEFHGMLNKMRKK